MIVELLKSLTYPIGVIGILANAVLIQAIRKHTPSTLSVYATIFLGSALCDCIGLLTMMVTTAREVMFNESCILEFYGVCTYISDEFCWVSFGIQEHMYSTAVSLLCLSFGYRFHAIGYEKITRKTASLTSISSKFQFVQVVICLILLAVLVNAHIVPGYFFALGNVRTEIAFMEGYRQHRPDAPSSLGLIYTPDLFSYCVLSYTLLTSLVCFLIIVQLRKRTIKRFADFESTMSTSAKVNQKMLSEALIVQLAASSFFFIGCIIFTVNITFSNDLEIAFISVPIANLQNVCTPLTTLYIITPYRRFMTQTVPVPLRCWKDTVIPISTATNSNMTSITQHTVASRV